MAKRLTPVQRAEMMSEAYSLSLRGYTNRQIAQRLGTTHKTISSLLKEATEHARHEVVDYFQVSMDSRKQLVKRLWEILEKEGISDHAAAQVAHALNSSFDSLDLLAGTRAPSRSKVDVDANVRTWQQGLAFLSDAELIALEKLCDKMLEKVDKEVDVLAEITSKYEAGTLTAGEDSSLELEAAEEDSY